MFGCKRFKKFLIKKSLQDSHVSKYLSYKHKLKNKVNI